MRLVFASFRYCVSFYCVDKRSEPVSVNGLRVRARTSKFAKVEGFDRISHDLAPARRHITYSMWMICFHLYRANIDFTKQNDVKLYLIDSATIRSNRDTVAGAH